MHIQANNNLNHESMIPRKVKTGIKLASTLACAMIFINACSKIEESTFNHLSEKKSLFSYQGRIIEIPSHLLDVTSDSVAKMFAFTIGNVGPYLIVVPTFFFLLYITEIG